MFSYLRFLGGRGLSLDDAPWRHSLDNVREGVPDTHCDGWRKLHNGVEVGGWVACLCGVSSLKVGFPCSSLRCSGALGQRPDCEN